MGFALGILALALVYCVAAESLNLVSGFGGMLSLAHAGFLGIGAYAYAFVTVTLHGSFWQGVLLAISLAVAVSTLAAVPCLRVHDDQFVLATFCLQLLLESIFTNATALTRGTRGVFDIHGPSLSRIGFEGASVDTCIVVSIAAVCLAYVFRLQSGAFCHVLAAIRQDEVFASSAGWSVRSMKAVAFIVSAFIAAIAGVLMAIHVTYIEPSMFTSQDSVLILSMLVLGGSGWRAGGTVGALFLVLVPECLRFFGASSSSMSTYRELLYGVLVVAASIWMPSGLARAMRRPRTLSRFAPASE